MKSLLKACWVFLLIFICLSCGEDADNFTPALESFELHSNSQIVTEEVAGVTRYFMVEGDGEVAVYRFERAQSNDINDDEFIETLTFELPERGQLLELSNDELAQVKAFYRQDGAWPAYFPDAVMTGVIRAEFHVGFGPDRWSVDIDIAMEVDGEVYATIQTNGVLTPQ